MTGGKFSLTADQGCGTLARLDWVFGLPQQRA
jgi:hypothetical protein